MARRALLLAFSLAAWPVSAQQFQGQVGTPDQTLLGEDWYLLRPSEMPSIPLEGVTVSVLDCGEDCPEPATTDATGWFTFPDLAQESARLRFDPPPCPDDNPECESMEPREEQFTNGSRTVLGAKWPAGVEDTTLRYMPSVTGTVYIKWKGEIPVLRSCGAAGTWTILLADYCRSDEYLEHRTFIHELTHVYERRLRRACWHQHHYVNGSILQEDWLRALDADMVENGLGWVGEYPTEGLDDAARASETLANFSEAYFSPIRLVRNRRAKYPSVPMENYKTYRDLETYAPNRYAYFEKLVFERYLDEKQWRRDHPDGEEWPGMCEAPPFESEQDPDQGDEQRWPFAAASKASRPSLSYDWNDPPPVKCSLELH